MGFLIMRSFMYATSTNTITKTSTNDRRYLSTNASTSASTNVNISGDGNVGSNKSHTATVSNKEPYTRKGAKLYR